MMLSPHFRFPFVDSDELSVFDQTQNQKKPFNQYPHQRAYQTCPTLSIWQPFFPESTVLSSSLFDLISLSLSLSFLRPINSHSPFFPSSIFRHLKKTSPRLPTYSFPEKERRKRNIQMWRSVIVILHLGDKWSLHVFVFLLPCKQRGKSDQSVGSLMTFGSGGQVQGIYCRVGYLVSQHYNEGCMHVQSTKLFP